MKIKKGDTHEPATAQIDSSLPLEDATVRFRLVADDGTLLVDSEATIVDAQSGRLEYHFAEGETDVIGEHGAEWVVESGTDQETHPSVDYYPIVIDETIGRT